jgi:hypothetical protein
MHILRFQAALCTNLCKARSFEDSAASTSRGSVEQFVADEVAAISRYRNRIYFGRETIP